MRNFAAIDFETANRERTSICSIGIVIVVDGEIRERIYRLVKPSPNYYSYMNTRIHGLTAADTAQSPDFPTVWAEIAPRIKGLTLAAHNSVFDEGCLKAAFEKYGMEYPGYEFKCTCRAARRIFGKTLPNHQLHTVAAHVGFDLKNHHHALADAEACAHIAVRIIE